jgi:hypothetical protein
LLEKLENGEIKNVDISIYRMEECDGGETSSKRTGYGSLRSFVENKQKGGKRTGPRVRSEFRKVSNTGREKSFEMSTV